MALAVVAAACGSPAPSGSPSPTPAPTDVASQSAGPSTTAATAEPSIGVVASSTALTDRPIASSGSIALLEADASLSIVEAGGHAAHLTDASGGSFGFPAWSPDGSRVAILRRGGGDASIVVFDAAAVAAQGDIEPVVAFRRPSVEPFYLYWTPDGTSISFLATEAADLSLRIAPADGSAPDGGSSGGLVRTGNPFYYDWVGQDRLLAHIGVGTDAFLGEIGLDGKAAGQPTLGKPADFRSAVASHDAASIGYVRAGDVGSSDIVLTARDGSSEHAMPVFSIAAMNFDPTGSTLAAIGPDEPVATLSFPAGPLRLLNSKGEMRTLIDGFVVGFWWSPDGKTIAALRVEPSEPPASPGPSTGGASPTKAPSPVHLLFVDVASGKVRSAPAVRLAETFVNGILGYFDQYALSHRMWAPDNSSILMPEVDNTGATHVAVRFPDGGDPILLDGELGFWSPR